MSYFREQLEETFKEMRSKLCQTEVTLQKNQELNLCLYLIEKKYHFSGNGIWSNNQNNVKPDDGPPQQVQQLQSTMV